MRSLSILVLFLSSGLQAQEKNSNFSNVGKQYFQFEIGQSNYSLNDKQPSNKLQNSGTFINFIKFTYVHPDKISASLDYQTLFMDVRKNVGSGTYFSLIWMRIYSGCAGYEFRSLKQRLLFTPFVLAAVRPNSTEDLTYMEPWSQEPPSERFFYKGIGLGTGISAAMIIKKYVSLGLETRYIKFNKTEVESKISPGYQLNRSIFSLSIKAGFRFGLKE